MDSRKCCVCGHTTSSTVWVHNFPTDPKRKAEWIEAMNLKGIKIFTSSRVCSRHFTVKSYVFEGSRNLNRNAKPSLYPYSSDNGDTSPDLVNSNLRSEINNSMHQEPLLTLPNIETPNTQTINLPDTTGISTTLEYPRLPHPNSSVPNNPSVKTEAKSKSCMVRDTSRMRKRRRSKRILGTCKRARAVKDVYAESQSEDNLVHNVFSDGEERTLTDKKEVKIISEDFALPKDEFLIKDTSIVMHSFNEDIEELIPKHIITPVSLNDEEENHSEHSKPSLLDINGMNPDSTSLTLISQLINPNDSYLNLECWVEDSESKPTVSLKPSLINSYECDLDLECSVEDLEPCQFKHYEKRKQHEETFQYHINNLIEKTQSNLFVKNEFITALEVATVIKGSLPVVLHRVIPNKQQQNVCLVKRYTGKHSSTPLPSTNKKAKIVRGKTIDLTQPPVRFVLSKKPTDQTRQFCASTKSRDNADSDKLTENIKESKTNSVSGDSAVSVVECNVILDGTEPSLWVVAPHLKANADRTELDLKIKEALSYKPAELIRWLMRLGLLKSQQKCALHCSVHLELTMDSNPEKYPNSGGYVWTSGCCSHKLTCVFNGSIFETAPHPPTVILKLLYHWVCQTDLVDVAELVNVSHAYVKAVYTWLRALCTIAAALHIRVLGGLNLIIEVGVIFLETTQDDGSPFKVAVLGFMERATKLIRLKSFNFSTNAGKLLKPSQILQPLMNWVHTQSTIAIGKSVKIIRNGLAYVGYTNVIESEEENETVTVMSYLRNVVSRMIYNTHSLVSIQIFQQFLDELVWREWFGTGSAYATFNNLVSHLAEQTQCESGYRLIMKLTKFATNPFSSKFHNSMKNMEVLPSSLDHVQSRTSKIVAPEVSKRKCSISDQSETLADSHEPKQMKLDPKNIKIIGWRLSNDPKINSNTKSPDSVNTRLLRNYKRLTTGRTLERDPVLIPKVEQFNEELYNSSDESFMDVIETKIED